ncbi:Hypothetical predicted protein [Octopus vulgaris]|uniref:Uncharacterized protein n=1 Tax=Octopus vulgaris TaxID=6645 RepID=A0AA36F649_OCTVU|nr:Hypothetical predicted protein [Octopus vulgaris]
MKVTTEKGISFFLATIKESLTFLIKTIRKAFIDCKSFPITLISKSVLYKTNISKRQFHQFPQLDSLKDEMVDEDLTTYRNYLQSLYDDMMQ